MPIEGLSDMRRITRDFKIRLGGRMIKQEGGLPAREPKFDERTRQREEGGYPKETEHFVMLPEEVPEDVRSLYGKEPKSLRMMLPAEWDATDPNTGDELVFNRNNRAYGRNHGLRCKGTGNNAEYAGQAVTDDEAWAKRIVEVSGTALQKIKYPGGERFQVRCLGTDCPKYLVTMAEQYEAEGGQKRTRMVKTPGTDSDAACKRVFILRAFLLHPEVDPARADYCRVMGLAEIASSSYNTMANLQSDFDAMRAFTGGDSYAIPFRLVRTPITTYKPTRAIHYVLKVQLDYAEAQRWAAIPRAERFMADEMRARLRQIAASPLAPTYDSVRDLVPQALLEAPSASSAGSSSTLAPDGDQTVPTPNGGDTATVPPPDQTDPDRKLLKSEIDELKNLCGGREDPNGPNVGDNVDRENPWKPATLARLREIIALYNQQNGTAIGRFTEMTRGVYDFVKKYVAENPA